MIAGLPQRPLVLFDREYGCASLVLQTADLTADKLIRLRSNRCLYSAPPAYSGRGRPRRHATVYTEVDSELVSIPKRWIQTVGVHE
ncbi:hypothetical protein QUA54_24230, partial [Microcoleus sp. MOSTC5]|uniref:hypothetical protein n=1 Tax=Microcoleus sp. MOSTC5 TaxID=3055378 RepID=UPI002FD1E254